MPARRLKYNIMGLFEGVKDTLRRFPRFRGGVQMHRLRRCADAGEIRPDVYHVQIRVQDGKSDALYSRVKCDIEDLFTVQ